MTIVAFDYGAKKIGVALATTPIAEPIGIVHNMATSTSPVSAQALDRIGALIHSHSADKVLVGVSEGKSAQQAQAFARMLAEQFSVDVEEVDETLSTHEAIGKRMHQKRSKRQSADDAHAAAVLLQEYLDIH